MWVLFCKFNDIKLIADVIVLGIFHKHLYFICSINEICAVFFFFFSAQNLYYCVYKVVAYIQKKKCGFSYFFVVLLIRFLQRLLIRLHIFHEILAVYVFYSGLLLILYGAQHSSDRTPDVLPCLHGFINLRCFVFYEHVNPVHTKEIF